MFILFRLLASSDCKTSLTYLRCSNQRSFVVSISSGFCQVPLYLFLNLSYFNSKDESFSPQLLERNPYDITRALEKIIYIDIGCKSAQRQKPKDTKDIEATLNSFILNQVFGISMKQISLSLSYIAASLR